MLSKLTARECAAAIIIICSQRRREKKKELEHRSLFFVYKQVDEHNKLKGHDDISLYNNVKLKCFLDHKRFVIYGEELHLFVSLGHYKIYIPRCSVGAALLIIWPPGAPVVLPACSPCLLYYSGNAPDRTQDPLTNGPLCKTRPTKAKTVLIYKDC